MKSIREKTFVTVIGVIVFSSLYWRAGAPTLGEGPLSIVETFSPRAWFSKSWQTSFEEHRSKTFGFRNDFVRFKNFLFDYVFNFGKFHFSYGGNILQGSSGYLFERGYIINSFDWKDSDDYACEINNNIQAVKQLSNALQRFDVKLIFNLFPNKVTTFKDEWPFVWKFILNHSQRYNDVYSDWEMRASENSISVVNFQRFLDSSELDKRLMFSKGGTHWDLVCATAGLVPFLAEMNNSSKFYFPIPRIDRIKKDDRALHEELDIWLLLNLPKFMGGFRPDKYFYYPVVEYAKNKHVPMTLYGDSYNGQWHRALQLAGVSTGNDSSCIVNRLLSQKEVYEIIERGGVFSLGYSLGNLRGNRIGDEVRNIIEKLNTPFLVDGWMFDLPDRAWIGATANFKFLRHFDESRPMALKFDFYSRMPSADRLHVYINGKLLSTIATDRLELNSRVYAVIPFEYLKKGVNAVRFEVDGVAMPVSFNINSDQRQLGICISAPTLEVIN